MLSNINPTETTIYKGKPYVNKKEWDARHFTTWFQFLLQDKTKITSLREKENKSFGNVWRSTWSSNERDTYGNNNFASKDSHSKNKSYISRLKNKLNYFEVHYQAYMVQGNLTKSEFIF